MTPTTQPTDPSSITTQRFTAAEHYAIQTKHKREPGTRATRSKGSHLGIVIIWQGPASGRPQPALRAVDHRNDLHKIVSVGWWPAAQSAAVSVGARTRRAWSAC